MADLTPGTVFTFRLANGSYGACRVLRAPKKDEAFRGDALVAIAKWFGKAPGDLKAADAKKTLRASGPAVYWMKGAPPKTFARSALVVKDAGDAAKQSVTSGPWEMFPNVALTAWREANEPDALARDRREANAEGKRTLDAQVAALKKRERIDLTGFVPLATPKKDRTPREVLVGFIAAMNQWEKESARVDAANPNHLAVHMNGDALAAIFAEFCTPKERKYGRKGSYSSPPEYDAATERIVKTKQASPRRVEIATKRESPYAKQMTYVLVKTKGAWLIDSAKTDGAPTIL